MMYTVPDCHLNGARIALDEWPTLNSTQLAKIVGLQQPGEALESSSCWTWEVAWVNLQNLEHATQDGDIPEGGWSAMYTRQLNDDNRAIAQGSPEYAGRDAWIQTVWLPDTRRYPLFLVKEWDSPLATPRLRLLDGHHRLAGAFHHDLQSSIFALVGTPIQQ